MKGRFSGANIPHPTPNTKTISTSIVNMDRNNGSSFTSAAEAAAAALSLRRQMLAAQIKEFEKEYKSHGDNSSDEKIRILTAALYRQDLRIFQRPGFKTTYNLDGRLPNAGHEQISALAGALNEAGCRASSWEALNLREIDHLISLKEVHDAEIQSRYHRQNAFEHIVRVGVASRRAFQLRREILQDQRAIMKSYSFNWISRKYSDWDSRKKRVQMGVNLVESALKRSDLKIDKTLPEAENWKELLTELLPVSILVMQSCRCFRSKPLKLVGPLAKALKEAGCSATKWEDLTAEDIHLMFAQDRALELRFPHHKGDPANLDPAALFTESFVARVREKAKVAEKKTVVAQQAAAATRQKKGVSTNISQMKGDARSVLQAYVDDLF
ncbi:hypothetical protein HDU97_007037 [Phlyctochytrium planicorne]|nr:hypothetical protein HDU97_007037 [Phlyctochytrium planicorne]